MARALSLFESERMTVEDAIDLTAASLVAYGERYDDWAIAYSGGKDSSATVAVVLHLIETGRVPRPRSLTVLYADTRMELPPLQSAAMGVLAEVERRGFATQVVLPPLDDRWFVYILGRGVPPAKHNFRWCTPQLKIEPMLAALAARRAALGRKLLMVTGVRVGESAKRDERIAVACGKDGAECGQGWLQVADADAIADTLAPLLHWRVCHVWDWLSGLVARHGFPTEAVAQVYGGDEAEEINARTGCIQCPLASRDTALDHLLVRAEWAHLAPLKRLRPLYEELRRPKYRLRKNGDERRKDGSLSANPMRMGPLTIEARCWALDQVLGLQEEINRAAAVHARPPVVLINEEERARIGELIAANTWPQGWDGTERTGDVLLPQVMREGVTQALLMNLEEEAAHA